MDIARCFLRVADIDNGLFERLGRYEAALTAAASAQRQPFFRAQDLEIERLSKLLLA